MRNVILALAVLIVVAAFAATVRAKDEAEITLAALHAKVLAQEKRLAAIEERLTDKGLAAAMERIENQRRKDREADRIRRDIERSGVTVTAEQETKVVEAADAYRTELRELFRSPRSGSREEARERMRENMELAKQAFRARLVGCVGEEKADKLLPALTRGSGGGFGR